MAKVSWCPALWRLRLAAVKLSSLKGVIKVSRRKRVRLTAGQIHAALDRLCEGAPAQDAQAALRDLRQ